jgi:hypothetical protein
MLYWTDSFIHSEEVKQRDIVKIIFDRLKRYNCYCLADGWCTVRVQFVFVVCLMHIEDYIFFGLLLPGSIYIYVSSDMTALLLHIRYPLSVIRYPLSVIRYPLSVIRYPLSVFVFVLQYSTDVLHYYEG